MGYIVFVYIRSPNFELIAHFDERRDGSLSTEVAIFNVSNNRRFTYFEGGTVQYFLGIPRDLLQHEDEGRPVKNEVLLATARGRVPVDWLSLNSTISGDLYGKRYVFIKGFVPFDLYPRSSTHIFQIRGNLRRSEEYKVYYGCNSRFGSYPNFLREDFNAIERLLQESPPEAEQRLMSTFLKLPSTVLR